MARNRVREVVAAEIGDLGRWTSEEAASYVQANLSNSTMQGSPFEYTGPWTSQMLSDVMAMFAGYVGNLSDTGTLLSKAFEKAVTDSALLSQVNEYLEANKPDTGDLPEPKVTLIPSSRRDTSQLTSSRNASSLNSAFRKYGARNE